MTNLKPVAGYSQRPLVQKLGIKAHHRVAILHAPTDYAQLVAPLPEGVMQLAELAVGLDFIHFFTTNQAELRDQFPHLKTTIVKDGMIWISWPKKAAKLPTDLDENIIREFGLALGLVDVKVAAIDQTWSGLKFVYRKVDRK